MGKMILPFPQSVNHYLEYYCERSTRWDVHPVRTRLTAKAKQFKHDAGWEAKAAGVRVHDGRVAVLVEVYPDGRPVDLDNMLKLIMDSLENIAYNNDNQVDDLHIIRRPRVKSRRIEVTVTPLEQAN